MLRSSVRKRFAGLRPEEAMRMISIRNRVQNYKKNPNYASFEHKYFNLFAYLEKKL